MATGNYIFIHTLNQFPPSRCTFIFSVVIYILTTGYLLRSNFKKQKVYGDLYAQRFPDRYAPAPAPAKFLAVLQRTSCKQRRDGVSGTQKCIISALSR